MSQTTKGMTPGDALIAIGTWLNEGHDIDEKAIAEECWHSLDKGNIMIYPHQEQVFEYRKRPKKLRTTWVFEIWLDSDVAMPADAKEIVELDDEARALLEKAGRL